jgi:hypothetical protein
LGEPAKFVDTLEGPNSGNGETGNADFCKDFVAGESRRRDEGIQDQETDDCDVLGRKVVTKGTASRMLKTKTETKMGKENPGV